MDMKSKVGPMSIQLPLSQRIDSIEAYYTGVEDAGEPISQEALDATVAFFSKAGGIQLRSRDKVIKNMRLCTNSGNPYFTKRRLVKHLPQGPYPYVAILGWRGQEGGIHEEDVKQRVVWMMPFLLNVAELQFYQPAIAAMQRTGLIPAYVSMEAVDAEVTALFDTKNPEDDVICTDFTKFDQHFNKHLQDAAYYIENKLMSKGQTLDRELFDIKFNIPLICTENLMFTGLHGMGSGSGGTNFDECMGHKSMQFESAIKAKAKLNPHSMAYGDDGILSYPGIKVDDVIRTYTSHGQEMNKTKQYVSKHDCVVLRRWHGTDYRVNGIMVGVYSTFRALGRLLAQERYYDPEKWSNKMVVLRTLSILENCKWHPLFHEFIDFVMKGDKYRLGLNIPGFYDDLTKIARTAIENFTDFLGYTKNLQNTDSYGGIEQWEVVKYVKSKE
uniref:Putative RNA-dependent RNA polymerase n=1 Tax=Dromedary picobirnavirus TaxID=1574421 RepID=A0A0A1ENY6_9VIRU|nr:putative RNA-dependent RNA polymerase [Dromedary picobirnavirus]